MQRHARVRAHAMPVGVVLGQLAGLGHLQRLGLELLQADDVRPVALEPLAQLRGARPDAVDVPGRDLQEPFTTLIWLSTPFTPSTLAATCAARLRSAGEAAVPQRVTLPSAAVTSMPAAGIFLSDSSARFT